MGSRHWTFGEKQVIKRATTWKKALPELPGRSAVAVRLMWNRYHRSGDELAVARYARTPQEECFARLMAQTRRIARRDHLQVDAGWLLRVLRDEWPTLTAPEPSEGRGA